MIKVAQPFLLGKLLLYFRYVILLTTKTSIQSYNDLINIRSNRDDNKISYQEAIIYASEIVLLNALGTLLSAQIYVWGQQNGMQIRVAISSLIYRKVFIIQIVQNTKTCINMDFISALKALRLSQTAFQKTSNGKIINLLSNDVKCLDWLLFYGNSLWSAPLVTIVCGFLMYDEIGWSAIIGIGVILVIVPIQS